VAATPTSAGDSSSSADPIRWPADGLPESAVREIRRIKARVEAERLPRGADPALHTKLGRGGLADIEWTVQLLQLRHAATVPDLRTTRTLPALDAARDAGLLDPIDAKILAEAWRLVSRVRNGITLVRGLPSDTLPSDLRGLSGIARYLQYAPGEVGRCWRLPADHPASPGHRGEGVLRVSPVFRRAAEGQRSSRSDARRSARTGSSAAGLAVQRIGDHFARFALAALVFQRSDSMLAATLAFVVGYLPGIFGGVLLAPFADRVPRKRVLLVCDAARAALVALLALAAVSSTPIWVLFVLLLASQLFSPPFEAARAALVPDLLPDSREFFAGTSLTRALYQINQVIGLTVAGVVVTAFSPGPRWPSTRSRSQSRS
jgi:hypothetical protein